jgi:hemoglobin
VVTVYELVGGDAGIDALVGAFYERVEHDAVLRPLYPDDLDASRRHLALFLAQYFGGPGTYSEQRGHPRLRMRHAHIRIGEPERDAWYNAMAGALADVDIGDPARSAMLEYFAGSADWMINQ